MSMIKYTADHEWARIDGGEVTVGITDYAQQQLGDVVYVELPEIGSKLEQGKEAAVVESAKAASEIYAPLSGEVVAINNTLADDPARVNNDAQGEGWFFKIKLANVQELNALMDEAAYRKIIEEKP